KLGANIPLPFICSPLNNDFRSSLIVYPWKYRRLSLERANGSFPGSVGVGVGVFIGIGREGWANTCTGVETAMQVANSSVCTIRLLYVFAIYNLKYVLTITKST